MSLRDEILKADDLRREALQIPEWGITVWVRTMTGAERDAFEESTYRVNGDNVEVNRKNLRARLAVLTLCDESGSRLFGDDETDLVAKKSSAAVDRIFELASRINGISKSDEETLAKN